jgi:hypothetical protein
VTENMEAYIIFVRKGREGELLVRHGRWCCCLDGAEIDRQIDGKGDEEQNRREE